MKVLFVCMGNICRSPLAEGVFQHHVDARGRSDISCGSAGTIGFHVGAQPDERSMAVALENGIDISHQRSQKITPNDLYEYDYIIAMDRDNLRNIEGLKRDASNGLKGNMAKVELLLSYAPHLKESEVPDPYYGGSEGFSYCYHLVNEGAKGLLGHILKEID